MTNQIQDEWTEDAVFSICDFMSFGRVRLCCIVSRGQISPASALQSKLLHYSTVVTEDHDCLSQEGSTVFEGLKDERLEYEERWNFEVDILR